MINNFYWGDEERAFALTLPLIEELERQTDAGVPHLIRALHAQDYRVAHLKTIVRLALVGGGGCDPERAAELVDAYLIPMGLEKARLIALLTLAALMGPGDADDISEE